MRAALVDTSRWQGTVDAAAIKAAGFCGIVSRCTVGWDGSNQPDPFYLGTQAAALELRSGLDPHEVVDQCWTWLQAVEQLSGRRPIVYTGSWFWDGAPYVGAAT